MANPLLSPRAQYVLNIDAATAFRSLVPQGPGPVEARDVLEAFKPADVLTGTVRDANAAAAVLAGLWLWHDDLDASHRIAQALETPEGAYWHAIIHRREGDFSNAKYWCRRVGDHATADSLAAHVNAITRDLPGDKPLLRLTVRGWDPSAFVDLVEAIHDQPGDPRHEAVIAIQRAEWQSLLDHSLRAAAGV